MWADALWTFIDGLALLIVLAWIIRKAREKS
jgi:hypothetical protein